MAEPIGGQLGRRQFLIAGGATAVLFGASSARARPTAADPAVTGSWTRPFNLTLVSIHAVMLHTGSVLLFSWPNKTVGSDAVLWHPASRKITNIALSYQRDIFCSGMSVLPDGRVFIAGGHLYQGVFGGGVANTTIFDPAANSWTEGPMMSQPRWYPTTAQLGDGSVMIFGGLARPTAGDLAVGPAAVWVAIGASLYQVVPGLAGATVTHPFATLPLDGLIGDVVTTAGSVWVDDTVHGTVYRYAAATGRLAATVRVGGTAGVMAAGDGGVWVTDPDARTVSRISVRRNRVNLVVRVPAAPTHLAASAGRLWATGGTDSVLVIGAGGRARSVPVAGQPTGLAAAGGSVWVASTGTGTLSRIDARRAAVVATVRVGERPYAVAASPQGVWVAVLGQPMMDAAAARGSGKPGWLLRLCGIG